MRQLYSLKEYLLDRSYEMATKAKRGLLSTLLLVFMTACSGQSSQSDAFETQPQATSASVQNQAENFAFKLSYGSCGTDVIDTFTGTYTKDLIVSPAVTTTIALSKKDMSSIFDAMQRINIFAYPSEYTIDTNEASRVGTIQPQTTYVFIVRNGVTKHSIRWVDNLIVDPYPKEAAALHHVAQLIQEIISQQPEVQQLPIRGGGCL
jgi:hypothetical protein